MTESEAVGYLVDELAGCRDDPVRFNRAFLRRGPYWSRQEEVARSVVAYRSTVVYSGNSVGKDYLVGGLLPWWLLCRPESLVIVTAPGQTTIGSIVWKEVRKVLDRAVLPFGGRISQGLKMSPALVEIAPGWQALGYSTTSVERASGQHNPNLLVIAEEASGIDDEIWEAIDSLGYDRLLAIGNPIRAEGRFVDMIHQADKDRRDGIPAHLAVNAIRIPSTDSPHAHLEKSPVGLADKTWLDDCIKRYGKDSMWVRSHIRAEIPTVSAELLIPGEWLDYHIAKGPEGVGERLQHLHPIHQTRRLACDLAEGVGRDSTCVLVRDDWGVLDCVFGNQTDIKGAAELIVSKASQWAVPHNRITYDKLGIGKSMPNHLYKWGIKEAVGIAGEASPMNRSAFTNLRSEAAWALRCRLDPSHVPDPRNPDVPQRPFSFAGGPYLDRLREELRPLTYSLVGHKVKLMAKQDHTACLQHSPDVYDTLAQSFVFI